MPVLILALWADTVCTYGLVGWWRESQFARPVRVGAVAPSQAPGEGGGSCKDPKGRSLSASGETLFGAAGRLDGGRSSWSSVSGSRDLELLQDSGLRGLGESRVNGWYCFGDGVRTQGLCMLYPQAL